MMKPKLDAWTIVVAGAWNVRVFSPEWVGKQLLDGRPMSIEVPVGPSATTVRYTSDGVSLIPADDRLIIGVNKADVGSLSKAEGIARKVLVLLPHTPVTAFGVNLAFEDPDPGEALRNMFKISDIDALSDFGCKIKRSNIVRTVEVDGSIVNVSHALDDDGRAEVHLNFHHDANTAEVAARSLEGSAARCLLLSRNFLSKVYACNLEDGDEQAA